MVSPATPSRDSVDPPRPGSPRGECRAVARLLARHDDPDLSEAEWVLVGTHLPRCAECRARLHAYRRQDWQLRRRPLIALDPRVRCAVYDQLAASAARARAGALRQGLSSLAVAATALLLFGGAALLRPPGGDWAATASSEPAGRGVVGAANSLGAAGELFAQPLTTLIVANPTRAITAVSETAGLSTTTDGGAGGANRPAGSGNVALAARASLSGSVRALYVAEGRWQLVVARQGGREETFTLRTSAVIRLADGRRGSLADLAVGAPVRVRFAPSGAVQEVVLLR